jgi:hypothetical protein
MSLTPDEVLDRLTEGPWRLRSLPTRVYEGTHMVGYADARFGYFELDESGAASAVRLFDRAQARRWLRTWEAEGFDEDLLVPWDDRADPPPDTIRAALERCDRILSALEDGHLVASVMETRWLERSPQLGWLFQGSTDEGGLRRFSGDQMRAETELLTEILTRQPQLEAVEPPEPIAGPLAEARARLAALFDAHGPGPARMMLWSGDDELPEGVMRFDPPTPAPRVVDGVYAVVGLDARGGLRAAATWPADEVRERLARDDERGRLVASVPLDARVLEQVARLRDAEALAAWHRTGTIHLRAGKFFRGGAESLTPESLLERYSDEEIPVAQAVAPQLDGYGFVEVRLEPLEDPSVVARSEDDAASPHLRYRIPHVWARKAGKIRAYETAFGAALKVACGEDALERSEEREKLEGPQRGYERTPGRRVCLSAGPARVYIRYDPIESGHGVHGEYVHARFEGLPAGLKLEGEGKLDVRVGGHLELHVEAEDLELGARIKRAVLEALP